MVQSKVGAEDAKKRFEMENQIKEKEIYDFD